MSQCFSLVFGQIASPGFRVGEVSYSVALVGESVYARGFSIAVAGLAIVFAALLLLTMFIATMPRLAALLDRYCPEIEHGGPPSRPESKAKEDDAVLAAIGFVLHSELKNYENQTKPTEDR
ncbi:hypothetical protein Poly51_05140 [Rubripirellula tenax]|uniref:Oxaloacetate decarboxylase, gamma chain n=1 Tax=Rubripirellula tenax TaxID=2528015 RepID=A0A5C6FJM1_9BACT|nr:hypothetical protein [Rubripirellula tenax]TWU60239.1 hypothetical protein Poly51_05140 [Rubripirellula tenax]